MRNALIISFATFALAACGSVDDTASDPIAQQILELEGSGDALSGSPVTGSGSYAPDDPKQGEPLEPKAVEQKLDALSMIFAGRPITLIGPGPFVFRLNSSDYLLDGQYIVVRAVGPCFEFTIYDTTTMQPALTWKSIPGVPGSGYFAPMSPMRVCPPQTRSKKIYIVDGGRLRERKVTFKVKQTVHSDGTISVGATMTVTTPGGATHTVTAVNI